MGLPDPIHILLGEDNVIILNARMFCHWVVDMDAVHLPLHHLPQGLV